MAIVRGGDKILKSDIPDSPAWFDRVIGVFNVFMDSTVQALRNRLTFRDNFLGQIKEFSFTHGVEQKVSYAGLIETAGMLVLRGPETDSDDYAIDSWRIRRVDTDIVGVTIYFRGAASTAGTVKFIILG